MKSFSVLLIYILLSLVSCAQLHSQPQTGITDSLMSHILIPEVPQNLTFAGEVVPLENFDTRESLTRELMTNSYLHSRTMLTLLATTRYFPIIEPILKKYGVPDDFKYLAMAESGLNPNVASGAGAAGLWQIMPAFAKSQGLQTGGDVDERYNIELATEAACEHLLDAKKQFGSWALAAAAYNLGPAGVDRRIKRQMVDSYYDAFLPEETMRYVFRILAFKVITENPTKYGYRITSEDYYKPQTDYHMVEVDDAVIDWSVVAKNNGTTYKMLRELNHWIRDYGYSNKSRTKFVLKVPNKEFRK